MNKNIRYIKTYISNEHKILCLNSCNLCPFLLFDKNNKTVRCSKYTDKITIDNKFYSNIINCNINAYSISGPVFLPLSNINIPDWCGLDKDIISANNNIKLYYKTGFNQSTSVNNILTNLPVESSYYVNYNNKLIKLESNFNKLPAIIEKTEKTHSILNICSCCGNNKNDVDRNNNLGMCNDCWEKHKNNKNIKYYSYVNNFRLKRNSTWIKDINEKIEEIL
jgi:hypothetical protein